MLVMKSHGIKGKFVKTFAPGSSEHLAIIKLDEIISKFNALLKKLDADTGVIDTNYYALEGIASSASDLLIPSPVKQDV